MFDPTTWVGFHTWLSLIGIATGFSVLADLIAGRDRPILAAIFLATAFATSATGFGFPFSGVLPSHVVGVVALLILAVTIPARYAFNRTGRARWIYAAGSVASLYLLVFVAVAQAFAKAANGPVKEAVDSGRLPVRSAAVVVAEADRLRPLLADGPSRTGSRA